MRYHVIENPRGPGTRRDYLRTKRFVQEKLACGGREQWLKSAIIARIEDMKTRQVIFSTFKLEDETWFAVNKGRLKNYAKAIRYWNRKLHPPAKDRLSILLRKEKAWRRRLTIARNKLATIKRNITREKNKIKQQEQQPSCHSLNNNLEPTSRSAAPSSATT